MPVERPGHETGLTLAVLCHSLDAEQQPVVLPLPDRRPCDGEAQAASKLELERQPDKQDSSNKKGAGSSCQVERLSDRSG